MDVGAEKKALVTVIGFLNPIAAAGIVLDMVPKWVILLVACVHSGCCARLNYILKPGAEDIDHIISKHNQNMKDKKGDK